ncbi:MAG: NTP transferase domain-containing protein [Hyphomicrobiales bacterium]|nr:NTP transferase domain-containing protein [Hyphomicrobiales bacterium]
MRIDRIDMAAVSTDSVTALMDRFAVSPGVSMWEVLAKIDANGEGVALVLDGDRRLLGLVTDGDIRRAILAHADFARPVEEFLKSGTGRRWAETLSAPVDATAADLLTLMEVRLVRHLPLLDGDGRVAGLALKEDLAAEPELPLRAVVMAGGLGTRLRPLTEDTPKPLLRVGDKPVIEHIVGQLRNSGVRRVSITTHYQADKIRDHFGDGDGFGVQVSYTHEEEPLGTAGALAMVEDAGEPLLVINGDILTAVDFRAMLAFHREQAADITIAVRKYDLPVPFGVVEADGPRVTALAEKPVVSHFINAGIYLLEPRVLAMIPRRARTDMTDLIHRLLDGGGMVASFPIHEYWIDIGQMRDYMRAQADAAAGKLGP